MSAASSPAAERPKPMRLFLCGDVMTGRGVDQILPDPCDPTLHESHVESALDYVRLAEETNGPIPRPQELSYVWGVALEELNRARPDVRIINLETSITRSSAYERKGINYRMSPENAGCIAAAAVDCCVLANNHVLDWGHAGLRETLDTLARLRIRYAGAGRDDADAGAPAILDVAARGRIVVHAFAEPTSGVPRAWAAMRGRPGVNLLADLSDATIARVIDGMARLRRPGDLTVASIHWGANWGYEIPPDQARFARALVDHGAACIVHGHSSHHAKGIEVRNNRLILYGCGDFLNDYEGIAGNKVFRDDLALMYFADVDPGTGELIALEMVPLQIKRMRLCRASAVDAGWLLHRLDEASRGLGSRLSRTGEGRFTLA